MKETTKQNNLICLVCDAAAALKIPLPGVHVFFFISTPFFSAQPGIAYRETVFEPQVCLDVCLTSQRTFVYEITEKVVLNTMRLGNVYEQRGKTLKSISFFRI